MPAPGGGGTRRRLHIVVGVGVAVILLAVAAGVVSVLATRGPAHPDAWDPRVVDLVAFVEDHQGAPFEHPVYVDFLSDEAFDAEVAVDHAELTDEDREDLARAEGMLRALGAASGDIGLFDAFNAMETGGTLAFYDPETRRVTIQGTELSPDLETTVVHELTHAWQDQHDDLDRFDELESAEEDAGFRAVVEGEATLVEEAFIAEMDADDYEAYEATLDEQLDTYDDEVDAVPPLLLAEDGAPYALGAPLLLVLAEVEGRDAVRDALADPPVSTEQLLDPLAYLDGDEPAEIEPPSVPGGGEALEEDGLGALTTFLLLADRVDPLDALAVADAWDGDTYVIGERDGTTCVAWSLAFEAASGAGRRDVDPTEILEAWADELPDAEVDVDGQTVEVVACDPGADAEIEVPGRAEAMLGYPVIRLYLLAEIAAGGFDLERDADLVGCYVDEVLGGLRPEELEDGGPDEERYAELGESARRSCD